MSGAIILQSNNERNKNGRERELLTQLPFGTCHCPYVCLIHSASIQSQASPVFTDDQTKLMASETG